jgi:hypothetical protein
MAASTYEALTSRTYQLLCNQDKCPTVLSRVNRLRQMGPTIHWAVECYHYERDNFLGENEEERENMHKTKKVITHTAKCSPIISSWTDTSHVLHLSKYEITQLNISYEFTGGPG